MTITEAPWTNIVLLDPDKPLDCQTPEELYLLGGMLHNSSDHEGALRVFIELAKTHPRTNVFYDQSIQYRALHRFEESLVPLSLVLATEPKHFMAWINAADSMRQIGKTEAAAKCFRRAVSVAEEVGSAKHIALACHNLSVTLWDLNEREEAKAMAERAVHLAPLDNHYRTHLASLQLSVDDYLNGWPNYQARFGMDREEKAEKLVATPSRDEIFGKAVAEHPGAEPEIGSLT